MDFQNKATVVFLKTAVKKSLLNTMKRLAVADEKRCVACQEERKKGL